MPSHIEPSPNTRPRSFPWSATVEYGGGVRGWVVPSTDHRASRAEYLGFAASDIGTFSADYSSASFTVTIEGGEAYAAGKYLCTTESQDIVLDGNANITVGVGYAADSSDDVQIRAADDFPDDGAFCPLWQFDTDADGVDIAYDRRPLSPDEAPGTVTYGRAEAEQKFIAESTADDRYVNSDGGTVAGGITIDGDLAINETLAVGAGASVAGAIATESSIEIGNGAVNTVHFNAPNGGNLSLSGYVDSDEVSPGRAVGVATSNDGTDPSAWVDVETGAIHSEATGEGGLSFPEGASFGVDERYATIWSTDENGGRGWRFRDWSTHGDLFKVENDGVSSLKGPLEIEHGIDDAAAGQDTSKIAMRRPDVAAEFVAKGGNWPGQIRVSSSEPSTYDHDEGDIWVEY